MSKKQSSSSAAASSAASTSSSLPSSALPSSSLPSPVTVTDSTEQEKSLSSLSSSPTYRCVHCTVPCSSLYRQLHTGGSSSSTTSSTSSTTYSIKLTTCWNCHQIVDPYIEREILLIVIDCILLRIEAYRHILYNRILLLLLKIRNQKMTQQPQQQEKKGKETMTSSSSSSLLEQFSRKRTIKWLLAWCLLDTYLTWETLKDDNITTMATTTMTMPTFSLWSGQQYWDLEDTTVSYVVVCWIALTSLLGMIGQWMAVYYYLLPQQPHQAGGTAGGVRTGLSSSSSPNEQRKNNNNINHHHHALEYLLSVQIYLALVLPLSFSVVTVLVIIWENTRTVRLLGSLLIAGWQYLALSVVSSSSLSVSSPSPTSSSFSSTTRTPTPTDRSNGINKESSRFRSFFSSPFWVALLVRIIWRWISSYGMTMVLVALSSSSSSSSMIFHHIPCVGLQVAIPIGNIISSITTMKGGGEDGLFMLPLCLT